MNSNAIRRAFVDFFEQRAHLHLPSLSLVPTDPSVTTLFTIAGMQQMIPYFLGREEPPSKRLVTVQRSVRTSDIEAVGDDSHLTSMEMLGNFSVGDYFKREAIAFTWEFLTETMDIDASKWWVTIYPGDEETRQAWLAVGLDPSRIGESEDNWWDQGPVGPCGPDSEIHYDRGLEYSCGRNDCRPENECCERFIETWNNVFMVFYQDEAGARKPLPWQNIDTGMGFERLVMVKQGADSVYGTDLFQPIIQSVLELSGHRYGETPQVDKSLRVIADHSRTITLLIGDGIMPSSEGRGYVLRRLLRRAALHGRLLGIDKPFLQEPVEKVIQNLASYYEELESRRRHILQVVHQEERRFLQTLTRGLAIFEEMALRAADSSGTISGRDAFVLFDTHGFPLELTRELAAERKIEVDAQGFQESLEEQRLRARGKQKFTSRVSTSPETYAAISAAVEPTDFTGYGEISRASEVVAIIAEGRPVKEARENDEVEVILDATPFYAESGGQVGDRGRLRTDDALAEVRDTQRPHAALIVHKVRILNGVLAEGDIVLAEVDTERRLHTLPHHSGTHLVHKALQEVLGPDAVQAGSLVAPDRLRFDFRWPRPLTRDELREVEDRVNASILANLPVQVEVMTPDEAVRAGAMALFGEKYGERVRVVTMGDWSKELCGGTHVNATGDIGMLVIMGETGIGSGIRRVEALAGVAAYAFVQELRAQVDDIGEVVGASRDNLLDRVQQLVDVERQLGKQVEILGQKLAAREAEVLVKQGIAVDGMMVVANQIHAGTRDYLEAATDAVKARLERGIVVLGMKLDDKAAFTMAVTSDLRDAGFHANAILGEILRRQGSGAGGSTEFARGGGRDASRINEVLDSAVTRIKELAAG